MKPGNDVMVEVFRTNVTDRDQADWIVGHIQHTFKHYTASFDLEDCDRILVVRSTSVDVQSAQVIDLLNSLDYQAEILPEE